MDVLCRLYFEGYLLLPVRMPGDYAIANILCHVMVIIVVNEFLFWMYVGLELIINYNCSVMICEFF